MVGEGRYESRNRNGNESSTRPGITNQVSSQKFTNNRTANVDYAKKYDEISDHIISAACTILAKGEYLKSHDRVCGQLHFKIHKEKGVKFDNEHCYKDVPKLVETSPEVAVTILWNQQVQIEN